MIALARYIGAHPEEPLRLSELARQAQLSPAHLQRRFKSAFGLSPKAFHEACRAKRFKKALGNYPSITEALQEAGYASPSRLYEKLDDLLGMTPTLYRGGAAGVSISYGQGPSPLGPLTLAATDRGVCFVHVGRRGLAALRAEFPGAQINQAPPGPGPLKSWFREIQRSLEKANACLDDIPLDLAGTVFQRRVWELIRTIPPGQTRSYKQLAQSLRKPSAARAVGRACATNRVALLIPCHRVLRGSGELAGYRWGKKRKQALLKLEQA